MSSAMVNVLGVNAGLARPADAHAHHLHEALRRRRAARRAQRRALALRVRAMMSGRARLGREPDAEPA